MSRVINKLKRAKKWNRIRRTFLRGVYSLFISFLIIQSVATHHHESNEKLLRSLAFLEKKRKGNNIDDCDDFDDFDDV
tara:strand:+ start:524 stop:757 length:234 start_codon:yes stop_codon:yes gene_type:complete